MPSTSSHLSLSVLPAKSERREKKRINSSPGTSFFRNEFVNIETTEVEHILSLCSRK